MLTLHYYPKTGKATTDLFCHPIPVEAGIMPRFYVGEDHKGQRVRLFSPDLEEGDQVYTVVCYDGWTVPVPFLVGPESTPA